MTYYSLRFYVKSFFFGDFLALFRSFFLAFLSCSEIDSTVRMLCLSHSSNISKFICTLCTLNIIYVFFLILVSKVFSWPTSYPIPPYQLHSTQNRKLLQSLFTSNTLTSLVPQKLPWPLPGWCLVFAHTTQESVSLSSFPEWLRGIE